MTEYREPTLELGQLVGDGWLAPTTHVGQFGLVVKCEYPRKVLLVLPLLPDCTGSPRTYIPKLESVSVVPLTSSHTVLPEPFFVTPKIVMSQTLYTAELVEVLISAGQFVWLVLLLLLI